MSANDWRSHIDNSNGLKHLYIYDNLESVIDMNEPNISYYTNEDIVKYNIHIHDYSLDYLTFESINSFTIKYGAYAANSTKYGNIFYYSLDNGNTWIEYVASKAFGSNPVINVNANQKIIFKSNINNLSHNRNHFAIEGSQVKIYGNIMSLLYGDDFQNKFDLSTVTFDYLFYSNYEAIETSICDTSNLILPATTLSEGCYYNMFKNNKNLINPPKILPALVLTKECYYGMFNNCTSLITSPILPALDLVTHCYQYMFENCSSLQRITCLSTTNSTSVALRGSLSYWTDGVSSTGTFIKNSANTTWGGFIPSGWTVENYTE